MQNFIILELSQKQKMSPFITTNRCYNIDKYASMWLQTAFCW